MRRILSLVFALLALAPAGAQAQSGALDQLPGEAGLVSSLGTPRAVAVSPEGTEVVVGSGVYLPGAEPSLRGEGLTVLRRDPADGSLTAAACANSTGALGCTRVPELGVVYSLAIAPATAPGGARIYALATGPRSGTRLFEFIRDATTGALVAAVRPLRVDVVGNGGTLTLGPGGDTLYVGGERGLRIYQRWAQPELRPLAGKDGCITATGRVGRTGAVKCRVGRALGEVTSIAIAPGGPALWLATHREKPNGQYGSSGVLAFSRNKPGTLAQRPGKKGCVVDRTDDRTLSPGCTRTTGVRLVYGVTAVGDTAVVAQADGGLLSFTRLFSPDLTLRSRAKLTGGTLVPPDGRNVYGFTTMLGRAPITAYSRSESGRLTPLPAPATRAMEGASAAAISPDGRSVYVASGQNGSLGVFSRRP